MEKKNFGQLSTGQTASLYEIKNAQGTRAMITDFGATIVSLFVKDKNNEMKDVICGYDNVKDYEMNTCYFGATVGRNANRIANSKVTIDGVDYALEVNDNENNLHSGKMSTASRMWTVKSYEDSKITFSIFDKATDQGFPGDATIEVTYELTAENGLRIAYYAVADKKTVFNMTNHAYFNLNGPESGTVYSQLLQLNASHYTPVSSGKAIPTGEIVPVEGTPFDFREAKPIGQDIKQQNEQLLFVNGYDHNFAIDKTRKGVETIGYAYAKESGIRMDVATDCVGIQLYTGNFISGQTGKNQVKYVDNGAFCLETQYFPNAVNEPNFVSPVVDANVPYVSETVYTFSVQ